MAKKTIKSTMSVAQVDSVRRCHHQLDSSHQSLGAGIKTCASVAVCLLHFAAFGSFGTAVATIVTTTAVVVLIIAVAVALVLLHTTLARAGAIFLEVGIQALALFAVGCLHVRSTAVAAVIPTAAIVVLVIAVAIALVVGLATLARA